MLVNRSSREHGGVPVKWLGDGVMIHHREPAGAVLSALGLVAQLPEAGLPPAHVRVAAGPVVAQGGDYFGRTVNLAARIAAQAGAGKSWSTSAWPSRPHPRACASWSRGNYHSRGSPIRCGCWRPAGRERLTPQHRHAAGPAGPLKMGQDEPAAALGYR